MSKPNICEEIKELGKKVNELKYDFTKKIAVNFSREEVMRENAVQFMEILVDSFQYGETVMERIANYGQATGKLALKYHIQLDEAIDRLSKTRGVIWKNFKEIMLRQQVSIETVFEVSERLDFLFDQVICAFSAAYIMSYNESLEKAEVEFLKYSTPVVPILKGISVMPIIGLVNDKRAEYLMKTVLDEAVNKELDYLFIDLSGASFIDTMISQYIYQIIQSLELVGVETILAGIRPEVSQTIVSLGIDFSRVKTYGSLQQALSRHM